MLLIILESEEIKIPIGLSNYLLLEDAQEPVALGLLVSFIRKANLVVNEGKLAPAMLSALRPKHGVCANDAELRR